MVERGSLGCAQVGYCDRLKEQSAVVDLANFGRGKDARTQYQIHYELVAVALERWQEFIVQFNGAVDG